MPERDRGTDDGGDAVTDDEFKDRQMMLFDEALALGTRSVLKLMFLSLIHTTIQLKRVEDRLAELKRGA